MKKEVKEVKNRYNLLARDYHTLRTKDNPAGWFYNEMLEMPATLELLGNVKGKKILDFGCGTGIYAKLLTKKGARLKGFDISEEMLKIARGLNPTLDLRKGSGYNIPFKEEFDIVFASLVLDYFNNWNRVFSQVRRVLKKNGFFIFSVGNPIIEMSTRIHKNKPLTRIFENYFKERKIYGTWSIHNKKLKMPTYHKTYETIIKTMLKNNFELVGYKDAFPIKKAKRLFPEDYKTWSKIPYFTVWRLRKK